LGDRTGERTPGQVTSLGYEDLLTTGTGPLPAGQEGTPEDTCITFASSGTTSRPKLIPHPQANVWRHAHDVGAALALGPQARLLLAVPFGGAYGFAMAITALGAGASLVIEEQFDPAEAAGLMRRHGVTHMFGTDDMLDKILDTLAPGAGFPALTAYGQANFTPALELTLPAKAAAHSVRLRACYGLSEGMALFAMQPEDASAERRAAAGGVPVSPAARIRCRSLETGELLAPGEPGELEIWSPNLTPGYVGDPEGTARAFTDDGYLRTGDLGSTTADGGMTLLSRIGDVLRIGGYLVNPLEIEETVLGLCEATACQVVAIDVGTSVRPVAFVIGGPGYVHDEQAIIAACRGRLATFKSPIRVIELDRFPTTDGPNGQKVQKNVLKQQASELVAQS
ncbi:MAG: hypothetical protein JWL64_1281, partial [Frankiales bacterium]|nr:hypothetical protein [Frankiales bacterium]